MVISLESAYDSSDSPSARFLDAHVFQFAGLEDFATLQAFHEFRIFFAAHDLHARVLAGLLAGVLRLRKRL